MFLKLKEGRGGKKQLQLPDAKQQTLKEIICWEGGRVKAVSSEPGFRLCWDEAGTPTLHVPPRLPLAPSSCGRRAELCAAPAMTCKQLSWSRTITCTAEQGCSSRGASAALACSPRSPACSRRVKQSDSSIALRGDGGALNAGHHHELPLSSAKAVPVPL